MAQFGFDTLSFVKRLAAAGMDSRQAEALAEALADNAFAQIATHADMKSLEFSTKASLKEHELATKASLKEHELATKAALEALEARVAAQMKDLKDQLTSRLGIVVGGAAALIVAILGTLETLG